MSKKDDDRERRRELVRSFPVGALVTDGGREGVVISYADWAANRQYPSESIDDWWVWVRFIGADGKTRVDGWSPALLRIEKTAPTPAPKSRVSWMVPEIPDPNE